MPVRNARPKRKEIRESIHGAKHKADFHVKLDGVNSASTGSGFGHALLFLSLKSRLLFYFYKSVLIAVLVAVTIVFPLIGFINKPLAMLVNSDEIHESMLSKLANSQIDYTNDFEKVVSALSRVKVRENITKICLHPAQSASGDNMVSSNFDLQWPLVSGSYQLTSTYGKRIDPITGASALHSGIDLAAPLKTPIFAVANGKVTKVDVFGGAGRIVIEHNVKGKRFESLYFHMYPDGIFVKAGESVTIGQKIGQVGSAGHSTGPHLHFEIHVDSKPIDPLPWMEENKAVEVNPNC